MISMSKRLIIAMLVSSAIPNWAVAAEHDDVVVISADDMASMHASDTADMLNRIPGVSAGDSSVSIRGSSNVKVLLDGRSVNDPTSYAGAVKWSMIPIERIDKIVVYKGRGGVAFGDNTEGGVIVITTKQASRIGGVVGYRTGNDGEAKADLNLQGRIGRIAGTLTAGARNYDGFTINDDRKERRGGMRVDYSPSADLKLFFSGDYVTQDQGVRGYPESRTPNSRTEFDDLSFLFGVTRNAQSGRIWYRDTTTRNRDTDKAFYSRLEVLSAGQSFDFPIVLPFVGPLETGTGFEWQQASGNSVTTHEEDRGWLHVTRSFKKKDGPWSAVLGIRGNLSSTFRNTVNPEGKVAWSSKPWKFELSAGRSNNLPTLRQRYNETSTIRSNPGLQMEQALNTGCSLSFTASDAFSSELSFFHRDITDRITYVRAADNTGRYENFGKVTYQGCEYTVEWKPVEWFEIIPSYMYLHAKNDLSGFWLPALPFHTVSGQFVLKPGKHISIRADLKYNGKVFTRTDNSETIPGYCVLNLRADYRSGPMQFYASVDNLLDRDYLYVDGYDAPPREWAVGMNYTF